jgi:predicted GNAT family acetyltransferase
MATKRDSVELDDASHLDERLDEALDETFPASDPAAVSPERAEPAIGSEGVRDNPSLHRFELVANGQLAVAEYRLAPGAITFTHTEVPAALNGRGIGSALVRGALKQARAHGLKVASQCSFVSAFLRRHREFDDLLLR